MSVSGWLRSVETSFVDPGRLGVAGRALRSGWGTVRRPPFFPPPSGLDPIERPIPASRIADYRVGGVTARGRAAREGGSVMANASTHWVGLDVHKSHHAVAIVGPDGSLKTQLRVGDGRGFDRESHPAAEGLEESRRGGMCLRGRPHRIHPAATGVDPVSWTLSPLGERSSRCRNRSHRIRRSCGGDC
jgi:hypothetical protein